MEGCLQNGEGVGSVLEKVCAGLGTVAVELDTVAVGFGNC